MTSLIRWNVTKALEKNPSLDLKCGIRAAQSRLRRDAHVANTTISAHPEEQHLVCALLAWQQLGHSDADSLYQ
ncbi:uncharacterized protein LOC142986301 [Anticarsia gemmatalis]|uniref:uncharacterized protein LOC142986301 n=1 Tax=Anticarsia gemmatalis TaxID=129554 RepID=UPI003F763146